MGQEKRDKEGRQAGLPVRFLGQSCFHRNKGPEQSSQWGSKNSQIRIPQNKAYSRDPSLLWAPGLARGRGAKVCPTLSFALLSQTLCHSLIGWGNQGSHYLLLGPSLPLHQEYSSP